MALDLGAQEDPSWVVPPSPENDLAPAAPEEQGGGEDEANVGEVLLVRRNAVPRLPPLATLTIGTAASVVPMPMAAADAKHKPRSSLSKPLFDLNENAAAENEAEAAAQAAPKRRRALNSSDVKEVAMAAAEAARAIPPTPPTLQLFPSAAAKASSGTKMPRKLQLFNDEEEEM